MQEDRRKTPREIVNQAATIQSYDGAFKQTCLVADISDGGARIVTERPVPDEFVLTWSAADEGTRKCRVVWRLDTELGVEFADIEEDELA